MPHYHFHVVHDGPVLLDTVGMELPDLDAAREHALRMTRGSLREAMTSIDGSAGWQVEVLDGEHGLVLLVPFPFRPTDRARTRAARPPRPRR